MRISVSLAVFGVAGLSALITAFALRAGHNDTEFTTSIREQAMRQEIDQLQKTIESLSASLKRINLNPEQPAGAAPASNTASPKRNTALTAVASSSMSRPPRTPDDLPARPERTPITMVNPTPEQQALYDRLDQRFNDPSFVRNLSLGKLSQMEEFRAIPVPLQQVILSKALEKCNNGEADRMKCFMVGPPQ